VPYSYAISKYETTNAQYAEFLNAKAASDPLELYNENMGSDVPHLNGGIVRNGVSGSYSYAVKPGFEGKPVTNVSFYDAVRFANWLHNGQGSADTETGAYTLLGGAPIPSNGTTVSRNPGAIVFLPSENEWYKAAYYDAQYASYFDFPTGTDFTTNCGNPGPSSAHSANCDGAVGELTEVGAYGLSSSLYGTFDQGGNVGEWNEQPSLIAQWHFRGMRGGAGHSPPSELAASSRSFLEANANSQASGFRVASLVPEPGTALLVLTGLAGLAAGGRRKAQRV